MTALCGGRTSIQRAPLGSSPMGSSVTSENPIHRIDPKVPGRVLIAHVDVDLVDGGDHFFLSDAVPRSSPARIPSAWRSDAAESPAGEPDAPTFTHEHLAPRMVTQVPAARDLRLHLVPATALAWEVLQGK